ncbi:MAG TPA: 2-C-methyl-D-erythritol 2,4-cyclodiphosphate synthase, partial [Tissierellaceae bacterium]|nr:2-C-methyl-D-erythritol 2,4-cyclodiphosphate synthase [Tissierellaceae bacterium]
AIMDGILGALALGDIGRHFPDNDPKYKDISSLELLKRVYELMVDKGYEIGNIDATVAAEQPKLGPYIKDMKKIISNILNTGIGNINIKATTTEELGPIGQGEGISAYAVCLLKTIDFNPAI